MQMIAADLPDSSAQLAGITRGAPASCNFKRRVVLPRYIKPVVRQVDKNGRMIGGCRKVAAGGTDLTLSRRASHRDRFRCGGSLKSRIARPKSKHLFYLIVIISRLINSLLKINALAGAIIVLMDFED